MKSSVRSVSRSQINRPPSASSKTFPKPITGRRTGATVRWKLNERGRIANFDLKTLRGDIVRRLSCVDLPLYTLEECRTFLIELAATAAAWQEEEIPYLIYLSDLYEKLLPGEKFSYQWPPADADLFPSADMTLIEGGTLPMIDQRHFKAYYNRAFCYDKLGEIANAVEDYSNAIAIQDDNPNAYHNRGAAREKIGRLSEAIEDYSQAIALDSGNPYIYNARGLVRAGLSQYETAIQDMTQAITLSPSNSTFYQNRGLIFQRIERYIEALRDYDAALRLQTQDAAAFNGSGDDSKRAIEIVATMLQTYINRGLCNASLGRYDAAVYDFSEVLKRDATNTFGLHNRGICYGKLGHHSQALSDFTYLIELNPKSVDAHMSRGAAFEAIGNYRAALEDYSAAVTIDVERSGMDEAGDIARFKEEHRATKASQKLFQIIRDQTASRKQR